MKCISKKTNVNCKIGKKRRSLFIQLTRSSPIVINCIKPKKIHPNETIELFSRFN